MTCSPLTLAMDMTFWFNPFVFDSLTESYQNLSQGETFDCGLTVVPCFSNITNPVPESNHNLVVWFDICVVYVGLTLLSVMGIVGNAINIVVIKKHPLANDSTNSIYIWLSVSDLLTALSCFLYTLTCFLCFIDKASAISAFNITFPYLYANVTRFSLLSLDFVTFMSIQRAAAVLIPFKVRSVFNHRTTNIVASILLIICIASLFAGYFAYYPRLTWHPTFGKTVSLGYTFLVDYTAHINFMTSYGYSRTAVDITITVISLSITVFNLVSQSEKRLKLKAEATSSGPKLSTTEVKVVRMSSAVGVMTTLVYFAYSISSIVFQLYAQRLYSTFIPFMVVNVSILLMTINSSFNVILYSIMSPQFRQNVLSLFAIRKKRVGKL